jgi:hypothetical protein
VTKFIETLRNKVRIQNFVPYRRMEEQDTHVKRLSYSRKMVYVRGQCNSVQVRNDVRKLLIITYRAVALKLH